MRRYMQGTLDYHCAIYAFINALACLGKADLSDARRIFEDTMFKIAAHPDIFKPFVRNETDHYWLLRFLLSRWAMGGAWQMRVLQPFGTSLLPQEEFLLLHPNQTPLYLAEFPDDPAVPTVWDSIIQWFAQGPNRTAIIRFHRYFPPHTQPLISHWSTIRNVEDDTLMLHDASSEPIAIHQIPRSSLDLNGTLPPVRIEASSILLLEAPA